MKTPMVVPVVNVPTTWVPVICAPVVEPSVIPY